MRVLGIDHGQVRIGLALSDPTGTLASPFQVLIRRYRRRQDLAILAKIAAEQHAEAIVVGLPLDEDGSVGKKAKEVMQFADALRQMTPLTVFLWDESYSTWEANQLLDHAGVSVHNRKMKIDMAAACVMLQGWLDARRRT